MIQLISLADLEKAQYTQNREEQEKGKEDRKKLLPGRCLLFDLPNRQEINMYHFKTQPGVWLVLLRWPVPEL